MGGKVRCATSSLSWILTGGSQPGVFCLQGTFGNIWKHFSLSRFAGGVGGGASSASSRRRPQILVNIQPDTGQSPTAKNYSAQMSMVPLLKNPDLGKPPHFASGETEAHKGEVQPQVTQPSVLTHK